MYVDVDVKNKLIKMKKVDSYNGCVKTTTLKISNPAQFKN